ncbi:2-phospho-L-lactate transferase CofD family protein, partial [Streptomyces sp. Wh19]
MTSRNLRLRRLRRATSALSGSGLSGRKRGAQPKVVALGGGMGLSASLASLRRITGDLTAVVTVADD